MGHILPMKNRDEPDIPPPPCRRPAAALASACHQNLSMT